MLSFLVYPLTRSNTVQLINADMNSMVFDKKNYQQVHSFWPWLRCIICIDHCQVGAKIPFLYSSKNHVALLDPSSQSLHQLNLWWRYHHHFPRLPTENTSLHINQKKDKHWSNDCLIRKKNLPNGWRRSLMNFSDAWTVLLSQVTFCTIILAWKS